MPDFNKERMLVKKQVHTDFQHQWQFRIAVEDMPLDFDIFVKDVTYGPIELEFSPIKIGVNQLQSLTGVMPVSISMTVRDHDDERIYKWFAEWVNKAIPGDGTVNPPFHPETRWIRDWNKYTLIHKGKGVDEVLSESYQVAPVQLGDITQSYSEHGFKEFPLTLIQFRS